MSVKLVVLAAVVATCCAKPYFYSGIPDVTYFREARTPSISYAIGTGFASNIAGVKQSHSLGSSFQSGDGEAYGSGLGSTDGGIFANGVGVANINPEPTPLAYRAAPYPYSAYPYPTPYYTYPYNVGYNNYRTPEIQNYRNPYINSAAPAQTPEYPIRDSYGNAIAIARNTGTYGNSLAQSQNVPFGSAASAINQNNGNSFGNGGSVISYAVSTPTGSNAKSFVQSYDDEGGLSGAVAASEDDNGAKGSTSQTFQQKAGEITNSGATAIDGPGLQATNSYSTNNAHNNNNNNNKVRARTFY